jgi:hypothetical protein
MPTLFIGDGINDARFARGHGRSGQTNDVTGVAAAQSSWICRWKR